MKAVPLGMPLQLIGGVEDVNLEFISFLNDLTFGSIVLGSIVSSERIVLLFPASFLPDWGVVETYDVGKVVFANRNVLHFTSLLIKELAKQGHNYCSRELL
jgi:hypothetical protein